jgi:prepilin-type N-terminal cleavage/methylation domain-containing protein
MLMMKNQKKSKGLYLKNQCGFTLIEMISAIVLLGVMGIFSTQFITSITQSARQTTGQKGLVDDAKLAMEYLLREVRVASEANADVAITASSITFDKFVGYTVDESVVGIIYSWDNSNKTLTRTSGTSKADGTLLTPIATTLATQVTSFTVAESAPDSNFYTFTMTLQGPNGENFTLQSGVRPRATTL